MADKALADMTIKELTDRLAAINKERNEIVKLVEQAAKAVGVVVPPAPNGKNKKTPRKDNIGKTSNKEAVQKILAGGKTMPTNDLVKAMTAETGGEESSAKQFFYTKAGKKLVTHTDDGWKLKAT